MASSTCLESHRAFAPAVRNRPRRGVAIFATNSPEYGAACFGCARIGAVLVPINLMLTAGDMGFVFDKTGVKALLVETMFLSKVNRSPAVLFPMDDAFRNMLADLNRSPVERPVGSDASAVIFTNGTTAPPKAVVLTSKTPQRMKGSSADDATAPACRSGLGARPPQGRGRVLASADPKAMVTPHVH